MKAVRRASFAMAIACVLGMLAGCGGGGAGGEGQAALSPPTVAKADATCRYFRRETVKLGKGVLALPLDPLHITVEHLVRPGIPLVQRVARRQQALAAHSRNRQFKIYAELFDPIVVLLQERLRGGEAALRQKLAADPRGQHLDDLLAGLGREQRLAARAAGLRDCGIDFNQVLTSSISG